MNCKLALYSLFCFYKLKKRTQGSCPAGDSKLAVDPFNLSQRESQTGHSSAGQPVQADDSVCRGASSPVPPAIPFPRGQRSGKGTCWLWRDFPAFPPAFQPPRAVAGSCPSTQPDLDDQNLSVKAAGSDKQPRFKYLLKLVQSKALSLQLPSPGAGGGYLTHLPALHSASLSASRRDLKFHPTPDKPSQSE